MITYVSTSQNGKPLPYSDIIQNDIVLNVVTVSDTITSDIKPFYDIDVLANDTDVDIYTTCQPDTTFKNGEGTWSSINGSTAIRFTPLPRFKDSPTSITYTAYNKFLDPSPNQSSITVNVTQPTFKIIAVLGDKQVLGNSTTTYKYNDNVYQLSKNTLSNIATDKICAMENYNTLDGVDFVSYDNNKLSPIYTYIDNLSQNDNVLIIHHITKNSLPTEADAITLNTLIDNTVSRLNNGSTVECVLISHNNITQGITSKFINKRVLIVDKLIPTSNIYTSIDNIFITRKQTDSDNGYFSETQALQIGNAIKHYNNTLDHCITNNISYFLPLGKLNSGYIDFIGLDRLQQSSSGNVNEDMSSAFTDSNTAYSSPKDFSKIALTIKNISRDYEIYDFYTGQYTTHWKTDTIFTLIANNYNVSATIYKNNISLTINNIVTLISNTNQYAVITFGIDFTTGAFEVRANNNIINSGTINGTLATTQLQNTSLRLKEAYIYNVLNGDAADSEFCYNTLKLTRG